MFAPSAACNLPSLKNAQDGAEVTSYYSCIAFSLYMILTIRPLQSSEMLDTFHLLTQNAAMSLCRARAHLYILLFVQICSLRLCRPLNQILVFRETELPIPWKLLLRNVPSYLQFGLSMHTSTPYPDALPFVLSSPVYS